MATAPKTAQPTPVLDWLYARREIVTYTLLGLALALAIWLVVSLVRGGGSLLSGWLYFHLGFIAIFLVGGLVNAIQTSAVGVSTGLGEKDNFRVLLMTAGGLAGLLLALLGFYLPFTPAYSSIFIGGLEKWRDQPGAVFWPTLAFLGGLGVLFASLNLARGVERSSGIMRRLLYGYNVVLSSVLLLLILLLCNVLAYARLAPFGVFGRPFDWTSAGIYTIQDSTKAFLQHLDQPVMVYALGTNELAASELENLLDTCRSYSSNFRWESLSRDRNPERIAELRKNYNIPEPVGLLVVYGTGKSEANDFIKVTDIFRQGDEAERGAQRFGFFGEDALMKSLTYLSEGKAKPRLYVLQGHGELELTNNESRDKDIGLGVIQKFLADRNYEVKELRFRGATTAVPEDADIVIVPRPTSELPAPEIQALRAYLKGTNRKSKGKMLVLTDVLPDGAKWKSTGLEHMLEEFSVKVTEERILAMNGPAPENPRLIAVGSMLNAQIFLRNPIGRAFANPTNPTPFVFDDVRRLDMIQPANPAVPSPYRADPVLLAPRSNDLWTETDLSKNPAALAADFRKNPAEFDKVAKDDPLLVCLAVSETKANPNPLDPHGGGDTEPRLIVFGDASWASNYGVERLKPAHKDLFLSCVNWLRARPDLGTTTIPGKVRKEYVLNTEGGFLRLLWLPGSLLVLAIAGLGLGVWVVRRR